MPLPLNTVFVQGPVTPVSADNLNTFLQGVSTVVALRAFTGQSGMVIYLQGLATFNDGGAAAFGWSASSTAADNGTTIIAPTGSTVGRWLALTSTGAIPTNTVLGNSTGANAAPSAQTVGSGLTLVNGVLSANIQTILRDYLAGLVLSNDSVAPNTTLDISAGIATDSSNTFTIPLTAWSKNTSASFALGTGAGGMGNGLTVGTSTWYHVFAIINVGQNDVYFDTSVIAANKPTGTTAFRRIGSFLTDGSARILAFSQTGNRFDFAAPRNNYNSTPGDTSAHLVGLDSPPGVNCEAILSGQITDASSNGLLYISSPLQTDVAANATNYTCQVFAGTQIGSFQGLRIVTDTQARIRLRVQSTTAAVIVNNNGWIDQLGRSA